MTRTKLGLVLPLLLSSLPLGVHQVRGALTAPPPQEAERCRAGTPVDANAVLERALDVMGVPGAGDRVLHFTTGESGLAREQSDRWYPPYLTAIYNREYWVDARTGNERVASDMVWPGGGPPRTDMLITEGATYFARDTLLRRSAYHQGDLRLLDPWAVLLDWRRDGGARYVEECSYRDYWRTVLERGVGDGRQRLYVDPKSGYPVKVDLEQAHYLWGQQHVEYLYSTWISPAEGGASYPGAAFRLEDGVTVSSRTVSGASLALEDRGSAPGLTAPVAADPSAASQTSRNPLDAPERPDTVRVGAATYLLATRFYTETVTLQGDTVYLLDATSGENRARADSAWIATLFPGNRPVVVVVTDLAWPHIAGVRFWVARGARIVTHQASRRFLEQVTARRWTLAPDALEGSDAPRGEHMRMTTVSDSLSFAGGRVRLYPIDGVASEGALMVWLPDERYLWASDFVQTVAEPSQYASEVRNAARRVGVTPERLAAEHLPLTPWATLVGVTGG